VGFGLRQVDALLKCAGCGMVVHEECYGARRVPTAAPGRLVSVTFVVVGCCHLSRHTGCAPCRRRRLIILSPPLLLPSPLAVSATPFVSVCPAAKADPFVSAGQPLEPGQHAARQP
jgi:hypothetical protein